MNQNREIHEIKQQLVHLTGLIEGFLSGLKGPAPVLSAVRSPKFPLPAGTNWQDIVIKLSDSYALISVRDKMSKPRKVNFVELDCYDKLRKSRLNPDRHWHLLQRLAEHDGTLPWQKSGVGRKRQVLSSDDEADDEAKIFEDKLTVIRTPGLGAEKEISRVKKTIQGLRQKLKAFFGLLDDPFCPYEEAHTYKTKFQLKAYNPDEWKCNIDNLSDDEEPEDFPDSPNSKHELDE